MISWWARVQLPLVKAPFERRVEIDEMFFALCLTERFRFLAGSIQMSASKPTLMAAVSRQHWAATWLAHITHIQTVPARLAGRNARQLLNHVHHFRVTPSCDCATGAWLAMWHLFQAALRRQQDTLLHSHHEAAGSWADANATPPKAAFAKPLISEALGSTTCVPSILVSDDPEHAINMSVTPMIETLRNLLTCYFFRLLSPKLEE